MSLKNKFRRKSRNRDERASSPIGPSIQLLLATDGESPHGLDDDCPICRALRESGEPVYTIDPFGELVLIAGRDETAN